MPRDEDEDPAAADWLDPERPTMADGEFELKPLEPSPDAITAPHDARWLPGFDVGRSRGRAEGWNEGHEDAMIELKAELLARGLERDVTEHIVLAVRKRLIPL